MSYDQRVTEMICDQCEHQVRRATWNPLRKITIALGIAARPVACGDTQSYEDDDLSSCDCRSLLHSI